MIAFDSQTSFQIFASPVEVEGYKTIIKNPMDLSTMRRRIKDGKIGVNCLWVYKIELFSLFHRFPR